MKGKGVKSLEEREGPAEEPHENGHADALFVLEEEELPAVGNNVNDDSDNALAEGSVSAPASLDAESTAAGPVSVRASSYNGPVLP